MLAALVQRREWTKAGILSRRELLAESIPFEPEVGFALQAALRGDPVIAPRGTGSLIADALAEVVY